MFDAEMNKDIKKPPVVEYDIPKRIFSYPPPPSADGSSKTAKPIVPETKDNVLLEVWDFS